MTTLTFDTHDFINRLESAGVSREQAEVQVALQKEIHSTRIDQLTTKGDLRELDLKIESRLVAIDSELKLVKWMLALIIVVTVIPILKSLLSG